MRSSSFLAASAFVLSAFACGSDDGAAKGTTAVSTQGFDKSCSGDADCVAVFEGNACNGCKCENAAVAASESSRYKRELEFAEGRCSNVTQCADSCATVMAVCAGGSCALQ